MTASSLAPDAVRRLIHAYNEAWNSHDLDAIVAFHTEAMVFDAHIGLPAAQTEQDVRAQIGVLFAQWPDLAFAERRLRWGDDVVVQEWTATGTLAVPLQLGDMVAEPGDAPSMWDGVDVITLEGEKVARKDSYVDVLSIMRGVGLLPG